MAASTRPRESLVRAILPGLEFRDATDGNKPRLSGHFSVFDQWTTIRSSWEGTFLERIAPGAFKKTITENRNRMRVLLNHGKDPQLGDKPLGSIAELREDGTGAYYEVDLFDGIPPLVMDGLRAGAYGASFRFSVMQEDFVEHPKRSGYNPDGLPERTIKEAAVAEFGPVTFGAYDGATAGVRSLTDRFLLDALAEDPDRLRELVDARRRRTVVTTAPNARVTFTSHGAEVVEETTANENRADVDALKSLTCAYEALEEFIAMENDVTDPTDAEDVAKAQQALDIITGLIEVEAQEPDDGADPPDMGEMNSETPDGETTDLEPEPSEAATPQVEPGRSVVTTRDLTSTAGLYIPTRKDKPLWRL